MKPSAPLSASASAPGAGRTINHQRSFALRATHGRVATAKQMQLAARMETTQKMIDYYERRSPNPTLDVMQKIAAALEVSVTELLGEEAVSVRAARKSGPTSKVQKVFDEVARLPRRQQDKIVEVVSALGSVKDFV